MLYRGFHTRTTIATAFYGLMLAAGCAVSSLASAATVSLIPSKDNSVFQDNTNNSNALGGIFMGNNGGSTERRALLAFDFSSIPAGATINSVSLDTRILITQASFGNNYTMHRLTSDWGEGTSSAGNNNGAGGGGGAAATPGDATWNESFFGSGGAGTGTAWTTPGGDFIGAVSATATLSSISAISWSSAQMAQDVQDWLDGNNPNYGWILVGPGGTTTAVKLGSRHSSAANQPQLVVDYTVVPVPAAAWLFGSGLLGLTGVARRKAT